jgi:hypothetical protein
MAGVSAAGKKASEASGRKARIFFFEKKKQKTFLHLASVCGEARQFEARRGI